MTVRTGKKLDLHESSSDDVPWYANGATGKHSLGWAVPSLCKLAGVPVLNNRYVQGDTSRCSLGSFDMKTKVVFQYMLRLLEHCFWFVVNRTNRTT